MALGDFGLELHVWYVTFGDEFGVGFFLTIFASDGAILLFVHYYLTLLFFIQTLFLSTHLIQPMLFFQILGTAPEQVSPVSRDN